MSDIRYDETFDVVVVGSGAAGMATALGAVDEGLSVLVVESTGSWGGSTAMSGGGLWLPDNPLMRRAGVADSRDAALTYMHSCIGEVGRAASRERQEAFVDGIEDLVTTTEKHGFAWVRAKDYPDYYPELPGGRIGRSIESVPVDSKPLGSWYDTQRDPLPLPMRNGDGALLARAWSTPEGLWTSAGFAARTARGVLGRKRLVGMGSALATRFGTALWVDHDVPLWLRTELTRLLTDEDGGVVGVEVIRAGRARTIRARRGVMLAAGGFEANSVWRRKYHGIDGDTAGAEGNQGGAIEAATAIGADTELRDDAWWGASIAPTAGKKPGFVVWERSMPYSIMIDGAGERFANESESYVDLGHHMLEHDKDGRYWLIFDARGALRYMRTFTMNPSDLAAWTKQGIRVTSRSVSGLAGKMDVDPRRLQATIEHFNAMARSGIDEDFARGNSAYDRYYGDPHVRPNPNLGPLSKGPFSAYRVVIGDLGTKGGVVTDADARALHADGTVIDGLYAAGNTSASVMGHTYPGPGSTIGPATVFGLRGARHMAKATA